MIESSKFMLFIAASTLLIVTPGPAVFYIVTRSISQGRPAGLASVFGAAIGNMIHALFAALGLSALLASSATLFNGLSYAGAAYLIFLGVRKFMSRPVELSNCEYKPESLHSVFAQGIAVGTLNPKTALFFLAFLPQFVTSGAGPVWLQLLILGAIFVLMATVSDGIYAVLAGSFGPLLKRHSVLKHEKYISGAVYCGLGVATAFSSPVKHT